jgi:hypothetical protein
MKIIVCYRRIAFAAAFLLIAWPAHVAAQSKGTSRIEFDAHVAPTGGRPEPVRQMTFYLLSKSMDEVRSEALQLEPPPEFDKFVDSLKESPELKTWMKKRRSVELAGTEFTKSLTPDEIVDVPEFFDAYMSRNAGFKGVGFPKAKFKEKDKEANPEKYKLEKEEYVAAIRKFIGAVPESVDGVDVDLTEKNPSAKWQRLVDAHKQRLDNRTTEIAQRRYLIGQADTNLDGQGSFTGLAPGNYWISMIGIEAISGDVRLRWNLPVTVRPGETSRVELTNLNAEKSNNSAQNSSH